MSKLKELRKAKGLLQSDLAVESGVSLRMIQQWEQGTKNINGAKIQSLARLSLALNCSICDILEDNNLIRLLKKTTL